MSGSDLHREEDQEESSDDAERGLPAASREAQKGIGSSQAAHHGAVHTAASAKKTVAPEVTVHKIEVIKKKKRQKEEIPNRGKYWVDCMVDEDGEDNLDISGNSGG